MQEDTTTLLSPKETKYIQSALGSLLYYAQALDSSILPTLSQLATNQAHPTQQTKKGLQRLLDYVNTYPNAYVRFHSTDMQLTVDSDAAYLVMPKARSRIAGHFRLLDHPDKIKRDLYNGAIHIECRTLRNVVTSAAEAETNAVFQNTKIAIPLKYILQQNGTSSNPNYYIYR